MNTIKHTEQDQLKKGRVPWWIGFVGAFVMWEIMPWALSLLGPRYGWTNGRPGPWNWIGLVPVGVGTAGLFWSLYLNYSRSRQGIEWVLDKSYFLIHGPYKFSRNPMYLSELMTILGWGIFYGSITVVIVFFLAFLLFNFHVVPKEESTLEAHFREAFLDYKRRVPRWF